MFTRRSILAGLAATPAAASHLSSQLASNLTVGQGGALGLAPNSDCNRPIATSQREVRFSSIADWLKARGEQELWEDSRQFRGFDADLIEMRLPIATKVRMQREREYKKLYKCRVASLEKELRKNGFVQFWMD